MNCIIIDDEATGRAIISQLCSNATSLNVLEEFSNAMQAIKYLNHNEVDLILLDKYDLTFWLSTIRVVLKVLYRLSGLVKISFSSFCLELK